MFTKRTLSLRIRWRKQHLMHVYVMKGRSSWHYLPRDPKFYTWWQVLWYRGEFVEVAGDPYRFFSKRFIRHLRKEQKAKIYIYDENGILWMPDNNKR